MAVTAIGINGLNQTRDELAKLFKELAELCSSDILDPVEGYEPDITHVYIVPQIRNEKGDRFLEYPTSQGSGGYRSPYAKIPKRLLEVIRALFDRTARFSEMAYLGGLQDGRDVLYQMASGQMSPQDVNEHEVRTAQKIQNAAKLHRKLGGKRGGK